MNLFRIFGKKLEDRTSTLDSTSLRANIPKYLILHSTYRYGDFDSILNFHKSLGWKGVGYHLFVSSDGKQYQCRPFNLEGAHAIGFNTASIGLCFSNNEEELNPKVMDSVKNLITRIKKQFPDIALMSHTEAQAIYFNRLLKNKAINREVRIAPDIYLPQVFEATRREMNTLLSELPDETRDISPYLKKFKNCPGEAYEYFK